MDTPDSEFSSPVEVKIEPTEPGSSIPFCPFAWGETSDQQPQNAKDHYKQQENICKGERNELDSEGEIKQQPSMDISSCNSTVNPTFLDTGNQSEFNKASSSNSVPGSTASLGTPEATCPGKKLPTCVHCPEMKFVSETHLLAHNIDKHGFQVPSDLEKTDKISTPQIVYILKLKCPHCDFTCRYKPTLETHLKTHFVEKIFHCTICDYKCSHKQGITRHALIHTGEKPFQCTVCDYTCNRESSLTCHMRTHTGEKPFQCTTCDRRFSRKKELIEHRRIHTGEKPLQCTKCDFKCRQQTSLVRHIKTHTGEKPFHCTMCDYKCIQKISLTKHLKTHTDDKTLPMQDE